MLIFFHFISILSAPRYQGEGPMSIKILLADDSITIQKVIGIIFGSEEYSLTVVDNGKAAVEKALEIIPDILLIDALMPGMSGYEVCEQIRATPELAAKPILLLTGSFEPFDETKAKNCGADDFISKPFESQQIIAKVTELCELSASRSFEAGQAETELELPATPPPLPEEPVHAEEPAPAEEPVHAEDSETPAQPTDIWGAFTTPEPPVEATAPADETEPHQTETPVEAADSTTWAPVDEYAPEDEEQAAEPLPAETAAEAPYEEEGAFGEVSFADVSEPAVVSEEPVKPPEVPEAAPPAAAEETGAAPATLTEEQLRAAISAASKEVIERIVWEVVPDLAEALIKEAIRQIKEGR
jgi:CheY-like chemotaxis protein